MPLKLKTLDGFKRLTEGSTVFLYRIQDLANGRCRVVITTSQYLVEVEVREKEVAELEGWLHSKGAFETEGYVEFSEILRR